MIKAFRPTLITTLLLSAFVLTGCDKAKEAADNAAESTKEAVAETAGKAVDAAKDAASATVDKAKEAASDAVDAAKGKVAEVADSMTATDAPTATEEMVAADNGLGKKTYDSICFACHAQGLAGAPKLGDKDGWIARIAQGNDTLYSNAINGYTGASGSMMPAKGGNAALADDDVKAAVDYMVAESQ